MRAAGLGSYLDGSQAREDENDANAEHPAVSSKASRSDIASWVEDTYMNDIGPDADPTEENGESDNGNAISHPNDNSMERYYYGNMDGAMDDVEDYVSKVEVAETDAPTPATHEEAREGDEDPPKPFDFFGRLSRELRDLIYAQPGMTEVRVKGNDDFDGVLGHGNKLRVTITKPLVSLCLVSKRFSAEYMKVCEDQEALFIRTSQFVHAHGYTDEYEGFEKVRYLEFHLGNWSLSPQDVMRSYRRRAPNEDSLQALKDLEIFRSWLMDLCSGMPHLRAVSFKIYVDSLDTIGKDVFEGWLESMTSLEKSIQLKAVEIEESHLEDSVCWDLRAKHQLMLLWKVGDPMPPTIMDPTTEYAESCCEGLVHGSRRWDGEPEWDYEGNYIGNDKTFPMGRTYY
jgi:hypothetical protein